MSDCYGEGTRVFVESNDRNVVTETANSDIVDYKFAIDKSETHYSRVYLFKYITKMLFTTFFFAEKRGTDSTQDWKWPNVAREILIDRVTWHEQKKVFGS